MKGIQSRIDGVKKTKQITNSMRLVASSKVHKSRNHMESNAAFFESSLKMMRFLSRNYSAGSSKYFLDKEQHEAVADDKKVKCLIVIISTDRGLCGGFNASIARESLRLLKKFSKENVTIFSVGSKVENSLERAGFEINTKYLGLSETPLFEEASMISEKIYETIKAEEIAELHVVYTEFVTVLEQKPEILKALPILTDSESGSFNTFDEASDLEMPELIETVIPQYISAVIYNCMVKSAASEQSARMTSMDSASRNSDDIVDSLTLTYNQLRQGKITQEINEIASGASVIQNNN